MDIAFMLLQVEAGSLTLKSVADWTEFEEDERELLPLMLEDIQQRAIEQGGAQMVSHMLDTFSNSLLISEPIVMTADDPTALMESLCSKVLCNIADSGKRTTVDTPTVLPAIVPEPKSLRSSVKRNLIYTPSSLFQDSVPQLRRRRGTMMAGLTAGAFGIFLVNVSDLPNGLFARTAPLSELRLDIRQKLDAATVVDLTLQPISTMAISQTTLEAIHPHRPRLRTECRAQLNVVRRFFRAEAVLALPTDNLLDPPAEIDTTAEIRLSATAGVPSLPILAPPRSHRTFRALQMVATPFRKLGGLFMGSTD